jgi:2-oxo-4-hydroxy-4-carboxy-5-ureidoimidazoline decarboxylase
MTIDDLNKASEKDFVASLSAIYEHSPWIAAGVTGWRPFSDIEELHAAMAKIVNEASSEEQLKLVRAHPDLGGRLARAGQLEPSSADEQASLGLDRLSDAEFETFDALNARYREKFSFPFVIAVRRHTRNSVFVAFQERLTNDAATERRTALAEITLIARFRLDTLLTA